jgi:hypothetical protein
MLSSKLVSDTVIVYWISFAFFNVVRIGEW